MNSTFSSAPANLDQVPVGVAHVTADLAATVDRRGQKLRSPGSPLLIDGADVRDTDVQEARGVICVERLQLRKADRDASVSQKAAAAQLNAIREWGAVPLTDLYAMLPGIRQPALVVHGSKDIVVIPVNAFLLGLHLPNAQLIMYPDASHGAASQHAEFFLEHVRLFLDA